VSDSGDGFADVCQSLHEVGISFHLLAPRSVTNERRKIGLFSGPGNGVGNFHGKRRPVFAFGLTFPLRSHDPGNSRGQIPVHVAVVEIPVRRRNQGGSILPDYLLGTISEHLFRRPVVQDDPVMLIDNDDGIRAFQQRSALFRFAIERDSSGVNLIASAHNA